MTLIFKRIAIGALLVALNCSSILAQLQLLNGDGDFKFAAKHRLNAHGDEFNALTISSDGQRLFTGTEKGDVIVWNVTTNRLERTLHQPSGIHFVAALSDARELIAAGSNHIKPANSLVRRWNVETQTFVDLTGVDTDSFLTALATDTETGLIAVASENGTVVVWDSSTNKQLARWKLDGLPSAVALLGRNVYVATIGRNPSHGPPAGGAIVKLKVDDQNQSPSTVLRVERGFWSALEPSPDRRLLSATFHEDYADGKTVVINPVSKRTVGTFGAAASLWLGGSQLMLFEWLDPMEVVQLSANGRAKSVRKFERFEADTPGRAFDLSGQVSNAGGSKVWASYSKGPGLLEFDLSTSKFKTLIGGPSGAYGLSVVPQDGQTGDLLTGGADGYVRLWNLTDLSMLKEVKVAKPGHYVSEVQLVPGSRRAVVKVGKIPTPEEGPGPSEIVLVDLETGQQKKLFDLLWWRAHTELVGNLVVYPEGNRIKFASLDGSENRRELLVDGMIEATGISPNKRWLAVVDETQKLTVFDLQTNTNKTIAIQRSDIGPLVVTDDGLNVYTIEHEGALTHWDISTGKATASVLSEIRERHSRVDFMTLANDDRWLVTAGNHRDVGIFDRTTGKLVFYMQTGGAASWVEKVWIKDRRMILTTDIGVLYDGVLQ